MKLRNYFLCKILINDINNLLFQEKVINIIILLTNNKILKNIINMKIGQLSMRKILIKDIVDYFN